MPAQVVKLRGHFIQLRLGRLNIATYLRFAEDGNLQITFGGKDPMRSLGSYCGRSVIPIKTEGGETLASIGIADCLVLDHLVLQILIVLPVLVSDGAHLFRRLEG